MGTREITTVSSSSPEQDAYEIEGLWEEELFGPDDEERIAFIEKMIPTTVRSVLDAGCGNGLLLNHLHRTAAGRFDRLCGVDRSEEALSKVLAEKHSGSLAALPFKDQEFDMVVCNSVIEHLPVTLYQTAIAELARVAKRFVFISVPYDEDLEHSLVRCPQCGCRFNPNYHLRSYRREDLETISARLKPLAISYIAQRRTLPRRFSQALELTNRIRRGSRPQPPWWTLCPSCSYRPTKPSTEPAAPKPSAIGSVLQSLPWPTSPRWIACLYEKA